MEKLTISMKLEDLRTKLLAKNSKSIIYQFGVIIFVYIIIVSSIKIFPNTFGYSNSDKIETVDSRQYDAYFVIELEIKNLDITNIVTFDLAYSIYTTFELKDLNGTIDNFSNPKFISENLHFEGQLFDQIQLNSWVSYPNFFNESLEIQEKIQMTLLYDFSTQDDKIHALSYDHYPLDKYIFSFQIEDFNFPNEIAVAVDARVSLDRADRSEYMVKFTSKEYSEERLDNTHIYLEFSIKRETTTIFLMLTPVIFGLFYFLSGAKKNYRYYEKESNKKVSTTTNSNTKDEETYFEEIDKIGKFTATYSIGLIFTYVSIIDFFPRLLIWLMLSVFIGGNFLIISSRIEKNLVLRGKDKITEYPVIFSLLFFDLILIYTVNSIVTTSVLGFLQSLFWMFILIIPVVDIVIGNFREQLLKVKIIKKRKYTDWVLNIIIVLLFYYFLGEVLLIKVLTSIDLIDIIS